MSKVEFDWGCWESVGGKENLIFSALPQLVSEGFKKFFSNVKKVKEKKNLNNNKFPCTLNWKIEKKNSILLQKEEKEKGLMCILDGGRISLLRHLVPLKLASHWEA